MTAAPPRENPRGPWRKSVDVDDTKAQVATIYWDPENKPDAFKFVDEIIAASWKYSDHIREIGRQHKLNQNVLHVYKTLLRFMDYKTGRCDPAIATIAKRARISIRTTHRALDRLRGLGLVDWARRTVRTDNPPGVLPQREQTSNAYFINLARLPIEILRELRQKLGNKLRETAAKVRQGSGPVGTLLARRTASIVAGLAGALSPTNGTGRAQRQALASMTASERAAHMYRDDPASLEEHEEMLRASRDHTATARVTIYPTSRTRE
jgi:hypothetical protein